MKRALITIALLALLALAVPGAMRAQSENVSLEGLAGHVRALQHRVRAVEERLPALEEQVIGIFSRLGKVEAYEKRISALERRIAELEDQAAEPLPASGAPSEPSAPWTFDADGPVSAKPFVYDGVVYAGTERGNVYALTVENGERLWKFQADAAISADAKIGGDRVLFGDVEGNVYAVDYDQGELAWKFEHPDVSAGVPDLSIDRGRVYLTYSWGQLLALDLRDGSLTWWFDPGNVIYSPAVERKGSIYVSVQNQGTYALDAVTGDQRWLNRRTGAAYFMIADDEKLFLGTPDGRTVALDRATGEVLWHRLVNTIGYKSFGAISAESLLVATWNSEIVSLSKETGEFNWISKIGDEDTVGTPTIVAVSDDVAYVGWEGGALYAVDLTTGSIMGTGVTEGFVGLSTTAAMGFVYAVTEDRKLSATKLSVSGPVSDVSTYTPAPAAASFEQMTPSELRSSLEGLTKRDFLANDDRLQQLVVRIAETGYHLLTKRSFAQDAIDAEFDANICDEASGFLGWRARSHILLICDDLDPTYALTVAIHESGHALELVLDPLPEAIGIPEDLDISLLSFSEARAQIFEAAVARQLAAYLDLDVETGLSNNDRFTTTGDDQGTSGWGWDVTAEGLTDWWVPTYDADGTHLNPHGVGYLLAWLGVFHDDELTDIRREFEDRGHLSPSSLMTLFNRLGNLDESALSEYVSLVQSPGVSQDIARIAEHLEDRDSELAKCRDSYGCVVAELLWQTVMLP